MKRRIHLFISGIVQGVYFRHNTLKNALSLGLTGWVKNLSDGRVECVAEGEERALEKLCAWCAGGPYGASVESVTKTYEEFSGEYNTFSIAY